MQMEDDEIEAEAAEEQEDSSGPRKFQFCLSQDNLFSNGHIFAN